MKAAAVAAALACAAALGAGGVPAEELPLCYNYGCKSLAAVRLAPGDLAALEALFAPVDSAADERRALAHAAAWLYLLAGIQTPVWRDRGGNVDDEGVEGSMDCIDHSTNTTAWLALAERRGWMKFHTTLSPVRRGLIIDAHWGARVAERASGAEWVIDTWFLDPGYPAAVYPLRAWLDGARPAVTEVFPLQ